MRWCVYSSEHSGHAPLFLALITTLKVITGLQEGTLLLWTAALTPGGLHLLGQEGSLLQNNPGRLVSGGTRRCPVIAGE